ncbi:MAG: hypothetical protein JW910_01130 [Anaerolineae bacterium]|nr:hypothetical protein [Anaerolineae bacterium]
MSDTPLPHEPSLADVRVMLGQIQAAERGLEPDHVISLCETAIGQLDLVSPGPARDTLQDAIFLALVHAHQRLKHFSAATETIATWQARTNSVESVIDAQNSLSLLLTHQGAFDDAQRVVEAAARSAQTAAYLPGLCQANRMQANLYWVRGQFEQAYLLAQQALTIAEQLDDRALEARARSSLGIVEQARGHYYPALLYSARAAELFAELEDPYRQANELSNLGEHYQALFDMESALQYHEQARKLIGPEIVNYDLDRNLAVDLIGVGRIKEGLELLKPLVEETREGGERDVYFQVLNSLGEAYVQLGNPADARVIAETLLAEAERSESGRHKVRAQFVLGLSAHAAGDTAQAHEYLYDAFMYAQENAELGIMWRTRAALAAILHKQQPVMARIHQRIARETVQSIASSIQDQRLRAVFEQAPPVRALLTEKL